MINPPHVHMQEDGTSLALWREPAKSVDELQIGVRTLVLPDIESRFHAIDGSV